jgi:hypothetical protein
MLQLETSFSDWEGSVLLKLIYPANTDLESKKEWIYKKYQRVASIEENRTIRFKGITDLHCGIRIHVRRRS